MIESCWPWMKRKTTEKGASKTRKEAEERWSKYWYKLTQKKIQNWIARIPRHLEKIRHLKGDNRYKEGRIDSRSDTKAGRICLEQLEAEMAQAQAFVTELTPPIHCGRSISISSTSSDSFNTSNTSQSTLRRGETQRTSRFQTYLNVPPDTPQSYSSMSIIMESGTSTPLIPVAPPGYSTPEPPIPEPLTPYTSHRYLTSTVLIYKLLFSFQLTIKSVPLRYSTPKPPTLEPLTPYSSTSKPLTPKPLIPYSSTLELPLQKPLSSYSSTPELSTPKLLTPYLFNPVIPQPKIRCKKKTSSIKTAASRRSKRNKKSLPSFF